MKKINLILFSIFCIVGLTACSSNLNKRNNDFSEIEYQNLINDYTLYYNQTESLYTSLQNNDFNDKTFTIYLAQVLENYYSIASNRISEDIENISSFTDKYIDYLAYTQAYVDLYMNDCDTIKTAMKTADINAILETKFYQQTMTVADSSIQFAQDMLNEKS